MTRSLRSELKSLLLAFATKSSALNEPLANKVLDDFNKVLECYQLRKTRKYLLWGLLIGRSVDSFTVFFLNRKHENSNDTFNNRIRTICSSTGPLTNDITIKNDLLRVKRLRNDLFHNSGRHFTDREMEDFLFKSARCIQQLIRDL